jgi:hypothetical protein
MQDRIRRARVRCRPHAGEPELIHGDVVPTFTAVGDDAAAAFASINSGAMANGKGQDRRNG